MFLFTVTKFTLKLEEKDFFALSNFIAEEIEPWLEQRPGKQSSNDKAEPFALTAFMLNKSKLHSGVA